HDPLARHWPSRCLLYLCLSILKISLICHCVLSTVLFSLFIQVSLILCCPILCRVCLAQQTQCRHIRSTNAAE
ncbi:hypothetical protein QBC40DRAFT_336716, partial [Triangularia verruculosa]